MMVEIDMNSPEWQSYQTELWLLGIQHQWGIREDPADQNSLYVAQAALLTQYGWTEEQLDYTLEQQWARHACS